MFIKFTALFLLLLSFSIHADIYKWVDQNGITNYSDKLKNKVKKHSRNTARKITFVKYKKAKEVVAEISAPVISNEYTAVSGNGVERLEVENREYPYIETSRVLKLKKKSRNRKYSIDELNQRCENAREELIEPLREEAIEDCMYRRRVSSRSVRENCERINKHFGDGGVNYRGFYIKRLFHDIPECEESYQAWNKRSRLMRGYSE